MIAKILLPLGVVLLCAADAAEDVAKKELQRLQGTWTMAEVVLNGQKLDLANLSDTKLEIKKNVFTLTLLEKTYTTLVKVDPSKNPKEIDLTFLNGPHQEKTAKGIYLLEKDLFKICRNAQPEEERPTEFASPANEGILLVTWKRAAKKE